MELIQRFCQTIKGISKALPNDRAHQLRSYLCSEGIRGNASSLKLLQPCGNPVSIRVELLPLREEF